MLHKLMFTLLLCTAVTLTAHPSQVSGQDQAEQEREKLIKVLTETLDRLKDDSQEDAEAVNAALGYLQLAPVLRTRENALSDAILSDHALLAWTLYEKNLEKARWRGVYDYLADSQPSRFWLGVQCEPISEYQVKIAGDNLITAKGGLKVNVVTSASPAEASQFQENDILTFFNQQPVNDLQQLTQAINENGSQRASISVVRQNQMIELTVVPQLRESSTDQQDDEPLLTATRLLSRSTSLPPGYEASITLKAGQPVLVDIQKDKDLWQVDSETLDSLPADVKSFAALAIEKGNGLMLESAANAESIYGQWRMVTPTYNPSSTPLQWHIGTEAQGPTTDQRLDKIEKQIQELREIIQSLKD